MIGRMRRSEVPVRAAAPAPSAVPDRAPADGRYLNAHEIGKNKLAAYWRDAAGIVRRREIRVDPCLFLKAADLDRKPEVRRAMSSSRHIAKLSEEGSWTRVAFVDPEVCKRAARLEMPDPKNWREKIPGWLVGHGLDPKEADVSLLRRWMVDEKIAPQKPRRAYLDIEADSRVSMSMKEEMRILCWTIVDDLGNAIEGMLADDTDDDERRLLNELWRALDGFDQIVTWSGSWGGGSFDRLVIEARNLKRRIRVDPRRWLWVDHLDVYKKLNLASSESGEEKQSFGLERVAQNVLKEGKMKGESGEGLAAHSWELWADPATRPLLAKYCTKDTDLLRRIEEKTGYLDLFETICEACGLFPNLESLQPTHWLESFLMRLGAERDMRFPTHRFVEETEKFAGAFVMEPTRKGILRDVHVADFARLYPSIVLSWNMSPETYRPDVLLKEDASARPLYLQHLPIRELPLPPGHCAAALTNCVFANEPLGILPMAIAEILRLRSFWSKRQSELPPGTPEWKEAGRRSIAYKQAANAFYGVVGSPFSRFFLREVAESIAQQGVWLIKETMRAAEARGYEVIYGDTDSLFVIGCSRAEFKAFVAWCNAELYPRLLKEKGCSRNAISLEAEKGFARLVMAAKKRYIAMWSYFKNADAEDDSVPEIKGLEFKRGDQVRLARKFQERAAYMLLGFDGANKRRCEAVDDPEAFRRLILEQRAAIDAGPLLAEEIASSVGLNESIAAYKRKPRKKQPPLGQAVGEWVGFHAPNRARPTHEGKLARIEREYAILQPVAGEEIRVQLGGGLQPIVYQADGAHIEVARVLRSRGQDARRGAKIAFFYGQDGEPRPIDDFDGEADRPRLWESQVWPPTKRLLERAFPGELWSEYDKLRLAPPKPARPTQGSLF